MTSSTTTSARPTRSQRRRPVERPDETIARLERSLLEAGPLTKYFNNPEIADEVVLKGGVITAIGRDGRLSVDPEPTCEAEMTAIITRLLAEAGATVDLEHTIVVHQIWDNQVRASVSIPPTAEVPGLHVPHLPQAAHHVRGPRSSGVR